MTFPSLLEASFREHGSRNAVSFVNEPSLSYSQLEAGIKAMVAFLEKLGLGAGDKVAILSNNMPEWSIAYFGITFMGAVAVPLLPDFSPVEIANILEHSETKAVFVCHELTHKLEQGSSPYLELVIKMEDFSVVSGGSEAVVFDPETQPLNDYKIGEDDLASIIYTSGTTGKSKGVMLTHRNICFTAIGSGIIQEITPEDVFLSILPLSHSYENTIGLVLPLIKGASISYLRKPPTPSVLLPALESLRPTLMLTVPLIIEKIYRHKVLPSFTGKWLTRQLYAVPFFRKKMNLLAGMKLKKTFGGRLKFFGIGGAKLDPVVEQFLIEARFPYAIGYGLTESAPLLAGANPKQVRLESTGPAMTGVTLRIHDPDPRTGEGEIWAKGDNVMRGYYKEPELTRRVLTEDGWLRTGDLGIFDKDNFLYIKGRLKNMIVSATGENIYPEEIESVINNHKYVVESLVIQEKGKLVALVHFNKEALEERYRHLKDEMAQQVEQKIEELKGELRDYVNTRVSKFSRIQLVIAQPDPFRKTATQKIMRYLYD